jgi:hypothetical protein
MAVAAFVCFASLPALTQAPPPQAGPIPPMPKPQNLKILSKDISTPDLMDLMQAYNAQLGVECSFCHAGDQASHKLNYVSDAKPEKAAARIMMTMTAELNTKYVSTVPGYMGDKVSCGTCHRGHSRPEEFAPGK